MQSSIVGLAQALTMFAGTFNKVRLWPLGRAAAGAAAAAAAGQMRRTQMGMH
jgi:hypothetical protein